MAKQSKKRVSQEQDTQEKRNWKQPLRWFLYALSVVSFVFIGNAALKKLSDPAVLPLSVVRIDGDFKYLSRGALERAVGVAIKGDFFNIDLDAVQQAAQQLPWVERVTVRRIWPDTITMIVVEQEPLAYWGKQRLISTKGIIFVPGGAKIPADLPHLSGPDSVAKLVTTNYYKYRHSMEQLDLKVSHLRADSRLAWSLVFKNGMELKLGKDNPGKKLEKFSSLYRVLQKAADRPVLKVDLRYANGAAIVWGESVVPAQNILKKGDRPITNIQNRQACGADRRCV